MKRWLSNTLLILGFVLLGACIAILLMPFIKNYEQDYYGKVGISNPSKYQYKDMVRIYGEPNEVEIRDYGAAFAKYDDFIMSYSCKTDEAIVGGVWILNPKYKFGWCRIHVGSTKEEVERAYAKVRKSPDPGLTFIDGDVFVEFEFDEQDVVKSICFFPYP